MRNFLQPSFMLIPSLACQGSCKYCFGPNDGRSMEPLVASAAVDYMEQIIRETGQGKKNEAYPTRRGRIPIFRVLKKSIF